MRELPLASPLLLLALLHSGCSTQPKAGEACAADSQPLCDTKTTVLRCEEGKLRSHACAAGCNGTVCDSTQAAAGEFCDFLQLEGRCRAADTHATLDCDGGCQNAVATFCERSVLRELACRGPRGCRSTSKTFSCDTSLGNAGDPCSFAYEGTAVCGSANPRERLVCRDGGLELLSLCNTGCAIIDGGVTCTP